MKKLLSLLLAVILMVSSISVGASASETEIEYGSDVRGFAEFLNILLCDTVDVDIERFDETMSRLEFAKIIAGVMNCTDKQTNNYYFTDAVDEASVNNLTARGIFKGDEGLFHPERKVTVGEVYTVLVRALGYEEYTNKYGNNTAGYAMIANSIDLSIDGLDIHKTATIGEILYIMTNAIHIPLMSVSSIKGDGTNEKSYVVYDNKDNYRLLEVYHGIDVIEGVVTGNQFTTLYEPDGIGDDMISINDTKFEIKDKSFHKYIGQSVIAYTSDKKDKAWGEVIYLYADKEQNDELTMNLSAVKEYDNYRLSYYTNDKLEYINLPKNVSVIYNGKALKGDYEPYIKNGIGYLHLFKEHRSGKYQTMVIESYKNVVVKSVNSGEKVIYFDDSQVKSIDFDANDLYYELYVNHKNDKINPVQLISGDLVSVALSQDCKYVKGYVGSKRYSGEIEETGNNEYGKTITLNGNEYTLAFGFELPAGIVVGDYVDIWLDVEDKVALVKISESDEAIIGYAYAGADDSNAFDTSYKVKIFNEKNEHLTYDLAEKVSVNNEKEKKSSEATFKSLCNSRTGEFVPQLIKYSLNSKNQIIKIDIAAMSKQAAIAEEDGSLWEMTNGFSSNKYSVHQRMFLPSYPLSYETKIFVVPPISPDSINDDTGFKVINYQPVAPFVNTSSYRTRLYKTNTVTPFVDYVIYEETVTPGMWSKGATLAFVVDKISDVWTGDEPQKKISGYSRGEKISLFVNSKLDISNVSQGDVIQYVTNTRGEMANIIKLYDVSEEKTEWTGYMSNIYGTLRMGDVLDVYEDPMNENQVAIALGLDESLKDYLVVSKSTTVTIYDSESRLEKLYVGNINEIQNTGSLDTRQKLMIIKNSQYILEIILFK